MSYVREYRKIKMIMNEMLDYCYLNGMVEAKIHFVRLDYHSEITISGKVYEEPSDVKQVLEKLAAQQQPEVEDYYEDLLGLRDDEFHVDILSALIDEIEYSYDHQIMTFKIIREH